MGRASAELGISQPVISKTIADLEYVLPRQVARSQPTGVEPTIYGRALLRCGTDVFDDLRRAVKEVEFLLDPAAGELRIGCTEPLASGFVPFIIDRLSQKYPRATFHISPGDAVALQSRELRQRNVEIVVIPITGLTLEQGTDLEVIFDDRHVIMASKNSKLARQRNLVLGDLIDETWILPPPDSTSGEYIAKSFRQADRPPQAHVVSFSVPLHLHMLATGRFITSLPRSLLPFAKHLPLKQLAVKSPTLPRPVGIVTLKDRTLSPLAQIFIEHARTLAKALPG